MGTVKMSYAMTRYMSFIENNVLKSKVRPTLEWFMFAAVEDARGNIYLKNDHTEKIKLLLGETGASLEKARVKLAKYIGITNYVPEDAKKLDEIMQEFGDDPQYADGEEWTPDMMVEYLLKNSTPAIKDAFAAEEAEESPEESPEEAKKRALEDELANMFKKKADAPSEAKPVQPKAKSSEESLFDNDAAFCDDLPNDAEPIDGKKYLADLTKKTKELRKYLSERIFGQDNAINVFATGYFQAELLALTDKKRQKPRATFLFAGPPGTGKTFLAENIAKVLDMPFCRFDMSEYADKEACIEFAGSDKVYKNGKAGNVTSFVESNPRCILLFDEIEKAHITVIHLFLQLLDAGRLRDNFTDNEISFKDVIVIFTTNAGKQFYENSDATDYSGVSRKVILKALQNDINPVTQAPFFPAAICSRFATGNVVMFNHISAHNLRHIAKREVLRHAENFEKEIGINVDIDERVYSTLLFAEGGAADARTVRARAETFFDDEMFELFRLISSESVNSDISDLEAIKIGIELPTQNAEVMSLYKNEGRPDVVAFCSEETLALCKQKSDGCNFIAVDNVTEVKSVLDKNDVKVVLIDINFKRKDRDSHYLNIEDIDSEARDFFKYIREHHADLPIYLLETAEHRFCYEERVSFKRQGMRDILELVGEQSNFGKQIAEICANIHQQQKMLSLAKSNRLVTYGTAQQLSDDGKTAKITLFDLNLDVALDPEDSKNVLSNVSKPSVRFSDVIGAEDAKKELKYFVEYLKNPKKYIKTGVRAPRGVLLYGPPGTGKTMLAKAVAGESDVTFITAEGNEFLKRFVGEGPQKVHELFNAARKYAPSILFVDEIDAIAKERKGSDGAAGSEEVLTAFLTEMDGFKNDMSKPVFVLAATNFEVDPGSAKSLDQALMRRFDRRVLIDLPDRDDRIKYMTQKMAGKPIFEVSEEMVKNIAVRSTGMSLASLESVFELALRTAIRDGGFKVTDAVLEEAFELFNSGEKKEWDASLLERTARHEAGHAFLCWQGGETPSYVTVVARSNHGGYMQHGDNEGKPMYKKEELLSRIRTSLGGRAAEIVYYGPEDGMSTGASGDLQSATRVARGIVCAYGMDDEFGLAVVDSASGEMSVQVRAAVNKLLQAEMQKAIELISANRDRIDRLVSALLEKNRLTGEEIDKIFRG